MPDSPPIPVLLSAMAALADDTRLRILRLLESQELNVNDLAQILQLPQPTVSRHLKTLAEASFVTNRREGTSNLYRLLVTELPPAASDLWTVARAQLAGWRELEQDDRRLADLLRQKQSAAQAFFAGAAAEWDRLRSDLYGDTFTSAALLSLLPPDAVVADLACGTGSAASALAPHVGRVFAIDNSPEMLAAARARCEPHSNVSVQQGDLAALPLEAGSCDAALLLLALTYVPDPAAALAEAARILKPASEGGGSLVVVDLLPHARDDFRRKMNQLHPGFTRDLLRNWCNSAGLTIRRHTDLPSPPAAKGPALFLLSASKE